jgi:CRP/FNR family transcriptional regulator, cyclic AMP receptor protein
MTASNIETAIPMVLNHSPAEFFGVISAHFRELHQFPSERCYKRGDVIFSPEDPPDEIYMVESGSVKLVCISPGGRQKIITIYRSGDLFGELCICGGKLRSEDRAVALGPTRTVSFKAQRVLELLRRKPDLAEDLLLLVCARLAELRQQIAILAFDPIPQRLARELLHLAQSLAGPAEGGSLEVAVNLTHEELAKMVGTSREVVSALMNQFRRRGLLKYGRRNIVFSPARLEEYLRNPHA